MLLHHGGFDLQDIFFAIPVEDTVSEGQEPYEWTKKVLTDHFKPQMNKTFERHVFRSMAQQNGESIAQYVTKLRKQAKYCGFADEKEEIRDRIV